MISAKVFRIRAGAVLLPLIVGMVLSNTGVMHIELPPWFLAVSYALLGWSIGLRFTRESVAHCARALPRVLAAILFLIAVCAVVGRAADPARCPEPGEEHHPANRDEVGEDHAGEPRGEVSGEHRSVNSDSAVGF